MYEVLIEDNLGFWLRIYIIAGTWIPLFNKEKFSGLRIPLRWGSSKHFLDFESRLQSTPDNSNLEGKQKKVRVIEGKILI